MSSLYKRLEYLQNQGISTNQLANQTGISKEKLDAFGRGKESLSLSEQKELRNTYQRTVYRQMRETGASVEMARRASWQVPDTAKSQVSETGQIIDNLTKQAMQPEIKSYQNRGITYDEQEVYRRTREYVSKFLSSRIDDLKSLRERYGKG